MNKWLTRFKQNPSPDTDSPDTMGGMSITSAPAAPITGEFSPTASTVSVSDAPDYRKYHELYHERAAIMQHDSGWSSDEANHWGLREAVYAWARDHHPQIIAHITMPPEAS